MKKLFFILISLISISALADLHNVQTIGQKNRNQAVGKGLQIGDSLFLLSTRGHSQDSSLAGIDTSGHVIITGCQCVYRVRDSISSTQILSSHTSPITLITAPGAGYFIKPVSVSYYYGYSKAAYVLSVQSGLTEGGTTFIENGGATDLLVTTANGNSFTNLIVGTLTLTQNQPISFYSNSANPTTGGGYLIIYIDYIIEKY